MELNKFLLFSAGIESDVEPVEAEPDNNEADDCATEAEDFDDTGHRGQQPGNIHILSAFELHVRIQLLSH